NDFAVPWQSGMTGLIVRTDLAPDIKSICDLFDPKYKGKVDVLTEMRDTVPLVMKCQGVDLSKATEQDWLAAIDTLKQTAEAAKSDLIFPSKQFTAKCDAAPTITGDEETRITQAFNAVVNG